MPAIFIFASFYFFHIEFIFAANMQIFYFVHIAKSKLLHYHQNGCLFLKLDTLFQNGCLFLKLAALGYFLKLPNSSVSGFLFIGLFFVGSIFVGLGS